MQEGQKKNVQSGKPQGLKDIRLPSPAIWTNDPRCVYFLQSLVQNGRHFTYHAAGQKGETKEQVQTPKPSKKKAKEYIISGIEVGARIATQLFSFKQCSPKQIIYFFKFPKDPILSQQELIEFLVAKFQSEIKSNQHLSFLIQQKQEYINTKKPRNYQFYIEDCSFDSYYNLCQVDEEPRSPISLNYKQLYQEKCQQKGEECTIEQNFNIPQNQNSTLQTQANNEQQEIKKQEFNPFCLEFIDPDLALILNKMYFLLDPNFIYELILVGFAQMNYLNVFDVLTFGKDDPKDFPQIIQNIYIQEVIKFTNCKKSQFYQILSIQGLKEDFNSFIKKEISQKIINEKINDLIYSFKNYLPNQNFGNVEYGNAFQGQPLIEQDNQNQNAKNENEFQGQPFIEQDSNSFYQNYNDIESGNTFLEYSLNEEDFIQIKQFLAQS